MNINILDFGAKGDGSNDASYIQHAINNCSSNGGGRVIIPSNQTFTSGPFELKSNVELYLEGNSFIKASTDQSLYTVSAFKDNYSEGSLWISARNANNISITGTGALDGSGTEFMLNEEQTHYNYKIEDNIDMRPHLLTMYGCNNITIKDVTFRNAAYWCIHPVGCQDILIHGIRILNSLKVRNCDGIDPDHSRNVRISDCYIESADDCICLKCRREFDEYGPTENVTVTGCTLVSTSCAIKLGSENTQGIRNSVFNAIIISGTNRAIGIQNRDEGVIENIIFSNIVTEGRLFHDVWWGKAEPIYITAFNREDNALLRFPPDGIRLPVGDIRNISFSNIRCISENGIFINGNEDSRPHDIQFDNVRIKLNKTSKYPGGMHDRRPCNIEGIINSGTAGFHFETCDDIRLTNCQVSWGENRPEYYHHALLANDAKDIEVINFKGESAKTGLESIVINK